MKRIFFSLTIVLLFAACQQNQDQEIERLSLEKQALEEQMLEKDSTLNTFFSSLNQIEENLQEIKEREGRISSGAGAGVEGRPDLMANINEDIRVLGELMEKNRQLIAKLNKDFSSSSMRVAELDKMLARLNNQLQEKEIEISVLKEELGSMNLRVELLTATVDTLEDVRRQQEQAIEQATLELNTAYFVMGSEVELINQGIIVRQGGFLGLGKTNKLNPDLTMDYFTRVDITRTDEITIPGRKPVLISTHPQGSWEIRTDEEVQYLQIQDYKKFWSTSRHLVILIE